MDTLAHLEKTIAARAKALPSESYVAKLNADGLAQIAQKLGEEATETVIASLAKPREELIGESADLIFHLLVLLQHKNIALDEVLSELERREGVSGLAEKASRNP